jgi:hypothetical protein
MKKVSKKSKKKEKPTPYRLLPKTRLLDSFDLETTENYPTLPFSKKKVKSNTPYKGTLPRRQIYPKGSTSDTDLKFSWRFECGNLDTVFAREPFVYEIHIRRDPGWTSQWYLFKCENVLPGEYTFIITGFNRNTGMHHHLVAPVALSMNGCKNGTSWMRLGKNINFWKSVSGRPPEFTISFQFTVTEPDTMYFAYTYPYSYTKLTKYLSSLPKFVSVCYPAITTGELEIPMVFWDGDAKKYSKISLETVKEGKKPLIIIAARHHPGETSASYAVEGFLNHLISEKTSAIQLKKKFSILVIPMINIDGVVCGFYRPGLGGSDINRIWKKNVKNEAKTITDLVDKLAETRRVSFFLDFHGHLGQWSAFAYGVKNSKVELNKFQRSFMRSMSKECRFFSIKRCATLGPKAYQRTMRVAYHARYQIPFSYTLEMSVGGCDFIKPYKQFTPNDYREIGAKTCFSIYRLFYKNKNVVKGMNSLRNKPVPVVPKKQTPKLSSESNDRS